MPHGESAYDRMLNNEMERITVGDEADYADTLAVSVESVLVQLEADNAKWKLHAERWEEVARNLGQVLAILPAPLNDTFRKICLVHEVTP